MLQDKEIAVFSVNLAVKQKFAEFSRSAEILLKLPAKISLIYLAEERDKNIVTTSNHNQSVNSGVQALFFNELKNNAGAPFFVATRKSLAYINK